MKKYIVKYYCSNASTYYWVEGLTEEKALELVREKSMKTEDDVTLYAANIVPYEITVTLEEE